MWSILSVAAALFVAAVSAVSTSGNRLLVVLDDVAEKEAYGQFLGDLTARGFQVSYETPRSEGLTLFHLGERTYDHLLFLPSKVKGLGPNLTPNRLVDFVNANGNILVALSSTVPASTSLVSLLSELDISLPVERTGTVVDHFNYDTISAAESHDVLVLDAPSNIRPGLKPYFELHGGVLAFPHAVGHVLGSGPLLTPLVRAPATAYSYNPKEQAEVLDADELFAAGQQLALVSVLQARNSARVTVLGSAEMLQDKWLDAKVAKPGGKSTKTQNKEFARRVAGWTFQEIGVLRVNSVEHRLQGSEELNPGIYRVKNDVSYTISLSEYVWDKWVPFVLPADDLLQLEFSMLSPFHRLNLELTGATDDAAIYGVSFTLPDQHGIFNFMVNYKRSFLTNVEEKNTVSVRHFAHDEWPRSFVISGAWPWISGIGATVTGFVGFCAIWMYSKPAGKKN
ncbi:Dolichyl-diphosphooligosaccharide-protein glycosyltransferase 48kDa subunit [Trichoderma novae-zelandiae]